MINNFIKWLHKPYFWNDSKAFKIKFSIGLGIGIYTVLTIFKPYNISYDCVDLNYVRLIISTVTTFNLLLFFFVITKMFPQFFNENSWTVLKHILTILMLIAFASSIRWLILDYYAIHEHDTNVSYFKMLQYSILFSIIPILVYTYIDERYHYNKFKKESKQLTAEKKELTKNVIKEKCTDRVTIYASNKKEFLSFKINNLIYITSESNYACFFIEKENQVKEHILRVPLKSVEKQLQNYTDIFRCHKSFIINTTHINEVSGNARGYFFHINNVKIEIPVSRKFNKRELQKRIFLSF